MTIWLIIIVAILLFALLMWGYRQSGDEEDIRDYDPSEYHRAREAYQQAQANFDQADPRYIDIAISDLGISENRVDNELRKIRTSQYEQSDQDTLTWIALACDGDLQHHHDQPALNRMTGTLGTAIWGYEKTGR